jgi:SWI/SNF-related matrix-associated actin-dependent regulator of chromatin subfamily A member 5
VERAQQKLKLDAMVVQQGRLMDKEKKLSKAELLDTLRFGADKIFRSKESAITDDDIDLILEEGRKRTNEMTEKLQVAEKGDMYDFRLDGGMSTQIFEGTDYKDKSKRDEAGNPLGTFMFIDPGKRERKAVASYSETTARAPQEDQGEKKPKLPRHLRLPKMEDWQFYNKSRLGTLQEEEIRLFDLVVERGEAPQLGMISKFVVLPQELHEEKTRLIGDAFGDWTKVHFNNFIRASAKHGRLEHEKIAKDVGRPLDETARYVKTFWEHGPAIFPPAEWDRLVKTVEKVRPSNIVWFPVGLTDSFFVLQGEKRLDEIQRLTTATAKLISMFDDPWEELTFRNVANQGRLFNAVEDRFLLCLTHLHG